MPSLYCYSLFLKHFLQSSCLVTQRTTRRHILEIMYVQCSLMAFDLYSCHIIMKLMKDKMVKRLPVGAYLVVSCTGAIVFSQLKLLSSGVLRYVPCRHTTWYASRISVVIDIDSMICTKISHSTRKIGSRRSAMLAGVLRAC